MPEYVLTISRTTLRELLQNAADASATKVTVKFETFPSAKIPLPQDPTPSALLQHTIQHCRLKRMVVSNNGQPFSGNDWSRLKRIAEGNPDETKIGAFGVGFYSVFAECEEPLVSSGNEAMAFYWKGNSLFTRTSKLKEEQENRNTNFVLDYRNDTTPVPALLPLCQFLATSMTFVGLTEIELFLDSWRLLHLRKTTAPSRAVQIPKFLNTKTAQGLLKVNSATHESSQIGATWLKVIGWNPKAIQSNSSAVVTKSGRSFQTFWSSITTSSKNAASEKAAKAERELELELAKDLLGEGRVTAFLHTTTAQLTSNVDKSFAKELERATKKPPPKTTRIVLLTTSHDESELSSSIDSNISKAMDVFANVLPRNTGRIFIGFPTHQTTGFGAHISAPSVVPTVERESIDLNARWVRTWNEEMLRAAGIVARIAWHEESDALKRQLDSIVKASDTSKLSSEHITKILPQALHNLNQHEFSESTPSSKVGKLIEDGFWACDISGSLQLDLLSSRGILPSRDIRLGMDELSFLEGIPFLPKEIANKIPALIKTLIAEDIITSVTITDIKRELETQSLNSQQLIEFLQWMAKRIKLKELDAKGAGSLLKVAVANDSENDKVIQLGLIKHFQTLHKIPFGMPVPGDTIPYKFVKSIDPSSLTALGWEELQIVPWVKFLLSDVGSRENDKRLDSNPDFAAQVLPAISKQWKGLSDGSKQTLKSLLIDRTVIPTKLGMRKPGESYFKSVKLFDDLPVITMSNLSDAFLSVIGVRKTIELNLVFARLLNLSKTDGDSSAWSHVELIKYLVSVRTDIPSSDIKKLQQTAICTAEGDHSGQRYKVSELYEPSNDLRPLQLKFISWPGLYRSTSEESKFLRLLGLRTHPSATELIELIASTENDPSIRDHALRYLVNYNVQHGYVSSEIGATKVPFLPIEGDEKAKVVPSACFTNPKASLFGYKILRQDLHVHAAKLGVEPDPPISSCVDWSLQNPPSTNYQARELFEYFAARLIDLGGAPAERLSKAAIVPIMQQGKSVSGESQLARHLSPSMCFLGRGGKYADILEYVDFGDAANAFLLRCGSKPEPTSLELAKLVTNEPARVLNTLNSTKRYLALLTSIAGDWSTIKKEKTLVRQMRESTFLLASIDRQNELSEKKILSLDPEDDDDEQQMFKSWQLARADKIVVVDDPTDYNFFKSDVLAAPQEEELENMYLALGASLISSVVTQAHRIGGRLHDVDAAEKMKKLVVERVKLFFSDLSRDQIKRDGNWVEKNLYFVAVSGISLHKSLKIHTAKYSSAINALYNKSQDGFMAPQEHVIYFKPGVRDLFHLSSALCTVCLNKTKPQQAIVLTTLLESNLNTLQARGYNVARILRKRQAEDRIQHEEKQKQLEAEQARMAIKAPVIPDSPQRPLTRDSKALMPGNFPETPEHHTPDNSIDRPRSSGQDQLPLLTSFKDKMRDIWKGNSSQSLVSQSDQMGTHEPLIKTRDSDTNGKMGLPPPYDEARPHNITDLDSLRAKLERTIKASKAWNSGSVESTGLENMIKETPSFCDKHGAENIVLQGQTHYGIKVFCAKSLQNPGSFLAANSSALEAFAVIILQVARAMEVPRASLHIFYDEQSESIAFNTGRAIFFNYRYFEAMHLADVQQGRIDLALTYWFITMCHEVTHNICDNHGPEFNFWM